MTAKTPARPAKTTKTTTPKTDAAPVKTASEERLDAANLRMVSESQADADAFRHEVLKTSAVIDDRPLSMEILREAVVDAYLPIFDDAVANGSEAAIRVHIQRDMLRSWLAANGANRNRKDSHYLLLALLFRSDYDSSCTHWVLTKAGKVANGGHSGMGAALAFFPEDIHYGIYGRPYIDPTTKAEVKADSPEGIERLQTVEEDGEELDYSLGGYYYEKDGLVYETVLPTMLPPTTDKDGKPVDRRVGEYDKETGFVLGSDDDKYRAKYGDLLQVTMVINAPETATLKMDDVRLEADYADFLQMIGSIKQWISESGLTHADVGQIAKGWYLRTECKPETASAPAVYGYMSKGGRPNKPDVMFWFLTMVPHLADSLNLLRDANDTIIPKFCNDLTGKGQLSLKDLLVAMMVSEPAGRKRLAKMVTTTNDKGFGKLLSNELARRYATVGLNKPNADQMISMLVAYGMGVKDPIDAVLVKGYGTDAKDKPIQHWQIEANRAHGWDRGHANYADSDSPESRSEVMKEMAEICTALLNDDTIAASNARKNTVKGKGKRGPNKRTAK